MAAVAPQAELDRVAAAEQAARATLNTDEEAGFEAVLQYYRDVAKAYNAMIAEQFRPLMAAMEASMANSYKSM
jgi:hypothetical protein